MSSLAPALVIASPASSSQSTGTWDLRVPIYFLGTRCVRGRPIYDMEYDGVPCYSTYTCCLIPGGVPLKDTLSDDPRAPKTRGRRAGLPHVFHTGSLHCDDGGKYIMVH